METLTLEQRMTRMEDLEAVKQLKALYCEICDDDHDPNRITSIFTEDGIWDGSGMGKAQGHAEIRGLFEGFQKQVRFSQHMVMNPVIEIDGDRAHGRWYFLGMFTFYEGNQAKWLTARYHEEYLKSGGEWKISSLRIKGPAMSVDYEKGWAPRD
ncbi:MAG: nuclear transport factor 2 family protein [Myxococcota bacterium]